MILFNENKENNETIFFIIGGTIYIQQYDCIIRIK